MFAKKANELLPQHTPQTSPELFGFGRTEHRVFMHREMGAVRAVGKAKWGVVGGTERLGVREGGREEKAEKRSSGCHTEAEWGSLLSVQFLSSFFFLWLWLL